MKLWNPATGQVREEATVDGPEQVAAIVAAARGAQPAWAARSFAERLGIMRRFRTLLAERSESLAQTLSLDTGKPIAQARGEVGGTPGRIDFFLENAEDIFGDEQLVPGQAAEGSTAEVLRADPLGVVVNISAWNYPWFVGSNVWIPALLAGNAVLFKPSEHSLATGLAAAALFVEAGVPPEIFAAVRGAGEAGAALLAQPIDGVFFTGSYATGKRIAEAVAGRMIPVQLELGGKDPAYVRADADPAKAAGGLADGAFYNNGQSCCAIERIYVHEAIYESFVESFVETVNGFVMGDPSDEGTYLGPITREPQIAVIEGQIADALSKGATLRTGGARAERAGWYFQPTVLTEVDHSMEVMREESFGPIIGIQKVSGDAEAVSLMGDTPYGLTCAVYGHDQAAAEAVLRQTSTGTAYWNCCDRVSPRLPWTGRGHSGIGSTLGAAGIRAFVRPRAWHLRQP